MEVDARGGLSLEIPATAFVDYPENRGSDQENACKQTPAAAAAAAAAPGHPPPSRNGEFASDNKSLVALHLGQVKRKKHRRGKQRGAKHRKWKPYNKLTWSERQELDERESKRATQKREEAFASGHPVAPYNTTQFLMEDHIKTEPISPFLKIEGGGAHDFRHAKDAKELSGSGGESSEDFYESTDEEEKFLAREFSETYNNIHAERLQLMTKDELIKEYLELEAKVELLEERLKRWEEKDGGTQRQPSRDGTDGGHSASSEDEEECTVYCEPRQRRRDSQ